MIIVDKHQLKLQAIDTARFRSGRSQVAVQHFGNGVHLLPIEDPCSTMEAGLTSLEPGLVMER
jgi:antitoxin VapB